ncbi:hypothetical protein L227DRAFT_617418 [Lentinus tigrinus ALCF2SS1-6]|uniref:F-box domain-containing protein n=2 Tax=Lentinus tigrinus TaxID=5365 RepID=A0A5C2RPQ5_9APHY|nr:hypothetical protein L227DRAFT_617418 [Lentinus tigrinus ALCF2SS1-6]
MRNPLEPTVPDSDHWRLSLAFGGTISYTIIKALDGVIDVYDPAPFPDHHTVSHWRVPIAYFPGVKTWVVSVDTTQDLLLVARGQPYGETDWDVTVHVRSLKRPDAPHPRARSRSLYAAPSGLKCYGMSKIQIHEQFVIWSLRTLESVQVEVWNWCTGDKIWGRQFDETVTYTLLDAAHILMASAHWDELRVYRFDPPDEAADGILRLGFPFEDRCNPHIQQSSIPAPPPNAPFWPDPELRVLMIVYWFMRRGTPPGGALLIPYTTFRRLLRPEPTTGEPTYTPPLRIPWEQWGAQGSVVLQEPADERVVLLHSYPYGSRVSFHTADQPGGRLGPNWWKHTDIVTFDLNPYGDKYAHNPYVACPPRPAQWSAEQLKTWIRDSATPLSASSFARHEESPTLYSPSIIAHSYGFTEFFPPSYGQLPSGVQEIGFRTHFFGQDGSEAIEDAAD